MEDKHTRYYYEKWYILFIVIVVLLSVSGCGTESVEAKSSTNSEITHPTEEYVETTVPLLDSNEYWEIVPDEIIAMLNRHG